VQRARKGGGFRTFIEGVERTDARPRAQTGSQQT
jgi:hypothetical protein